MTPKNQELRDSLKQIEATITSALAHQPEDDAQCGQFLYDALVSVFNTADLAAHKYRSLASATSTPDGAASSAPVPSVPEVPSVPSNEAKLREALDEIVANIEMRASVFGIFTIIDRKTFLDAKAALAAPPRNCDKYPTFNDAIRALADKRGWHDAKWDSERYCILASWLLAPATEKEGGNDGRK